MQGPSSLSFPFFPLSLWERVPGNTESPRIRHPRGNLGVRFDRLNELMVPGSA